MRTGPATLVEKQDYVLSCWAFDDQQPSSLCKTCGYRRNDLAAPETCNVTTLDLTPPVIRLMSYETLAHDRVQLTIRLDEGAKVYCAAYVAEPAGWDAFTYDSTLRAAASTCMDMQNATCGSFWVYDIDDIEDGAADGVSTKE